MRVPVRSLRMTLDRFLLLPLAFAAFSGADAQIIRQRFGLQQPVAWASLGIQLGQSWGVTDGTTQSRWQFGNATQYAASLEKVISGGASVGIRGTRAKVPLRYDNVIGSGNGAFSTDADADVSQGFATIHVSNGTGFRTVLELSAGATVYSNFRQRNGGAKLPPSSQDADFSFAFGYGFGYSFSPRFSIEVLQDLTTSLHQKTGLGAGEDSSVRMNATRLVGRFGLGG